MIGELERESDADAAEDDDDELADDKTLLEEVDAVLEEEDADEDELTLWTDFWKARDSGIPSGKSD